MIMTLAEISKKTRELLNLKQRELAKLIGTNQTEISFIERGFIPNDKDKINKIYALYNESKKGNKYEQS